MIESNDNISIIRDISRENLNKGRQAHKHNILSTFRQACAGSGEIQSISPATITRLAEKIKHKSTCDVLVLRTLKNGLMESPNHIEAFFRVNGAVDALVRDISGNNSELKMEAACCLCNLALGDANRSAIVMKSSGAYLNTYLHHSDAELVTICAWTIGNVCAGGEALCLAVTKMGTIELLITLLDGENEDKDMAAVYALSHFANKSGNCSTSEMRAIAVQLLKTLTKKQASLHAPYFWLMFLMTTHRPCDPLFIDSDIVNVVINLLHLITSQLPDNVNRITPLLFALGNLVTIDVKIVKDILNCNNNVVVHIFRNCLNSDSVLIRNEVKRIIGSMINTCYQHNDEKVLLNMYDNIITGIKDDVED